jgi:heme-degrading monooxygenase HmoA
MLPVRPVEEGRAVATYAVVRTYRHLRDFERVARLVEEGLVPILREVPGFRGYYAVRCGEAAGVSVTLFAGREEARAGQERGTAWVRTHLAELYGDHPPETLAGEVIVEAEP